VVDDVDCCPQHYVQWGRGLVLAGPCSEAVDPMPAPEAATPGFTLWLSVHMRPPQSSPTYIYHRFVQSPFLPGIGDQVGLWTDPEDAPDGPMWRVSHRYWCANGSVSVWLDSVQVDPDEETNDYNRRRWSADSRTNRTSWWTSTDGDLFAGLRSAGWSVYGEEAP
jgi:hypothetical protein